MKTAGLHFTRIEEGDAISCYDLTNLLVINTLASNYKLINRNIIEISDLFGPDDFISKYINQFHITNEDVLYLTIPRELINTFISDLFDKEQIKDEMAKIINAQSTLITNLGFKRLDLYIKDLYTEGDQIPVTIFIYENRIGKELISMICERTDIIYNQED